MDVKKEPFARTLMGRAGVRRFPATLITDAGWRVVRVIPGYLPPDSYAADIRKALEPYRIYRKVQPKVAAGEANYEDLYRFVRACNELRRTAEVREWGEKLLAMEVGAHHAETAFFLAKTFRPGEEGFDKYRKLAVELDPENAGGYRDEFIIDDAFAVLRSIRKPEDREPKTAEATRILESRLAETEPKVHPEKAQIMYGLLFQIVYRHGRGDLARSIALLEKGIACAPSTEDGKRMVRLLAQLRERQHKMEEARREKEEKEKEGGGEEEK
jgi:hypothetical protein